MKKNNVGEPELSDLKTYFRVTVIKIVWHIRIELQISKVEANSYIYIFLTKL